MLTTHERGWLAVATVSAVLFLVVGAPVLVEVVFQAVEPWLPR